MTKKLNEITQTVKKHNNDRVNRMIKKRLTIKILYWQRQDGQLK
jgi:hypothetical protein